MRWNRSQARTVPPWDRTRNRSPEHDAARAAYEREKQEARQKQIDLIARMRRLGYDIQIATRKTAADEP